MEISKLGNSFIDFGLHFFIILSLLGAIFWKHLASIFELPILPILLAFQLLILLKSPQNHCHLHPINQIFILMLPQWNHRNHFHFYYYLHSQFQDFILLISNLNHYFYCLNDFHFILKIFLSQNYPNHHLFLNFQSNYHLRAQFLPQLLYVHDHLNHFNDLFLNW